MEIKPEDELSNIVLFPVKEDDPRNQVNGAGEEGFTGNQLILVVQIQHPELFTLQSRHVQNQPFSCRTGGGEGHAGFMKMAVQGFQGPLNEAALAGRHLSGARPFWRG